MFVQQHTTKQLRKYGSKAWRVGNSVLESLLKPTYVDIPYAVNQRIRSCFDLLSDSTQCQILNSLLLQYEHISPQTRLRFLQLIQPRDSSVQELVRWIWERSMWEQRGYFEHRLGQSIIQDSWSLHMESSSLDSNSWKPTNDNSHENDISETTCVVKLSTNKRKRKEHPWYFIVKSMKSASLSSDFSEKIIQVLKTTSLDQLITYWKDWFDHPMIDRGSMNCSDDGAWICVIGNEIFHSYVEWRESENTYSTAHLVAVISYLFVPFVVRLRMEMATIDSTTFRIALVMQA
ncbi:uncharacterized protein Gasu_34540 [Galdieria sulphuraria]|uniref:Uncharacterized protein n=1 Tax=Galdieria sulphuraria TaxID=130081 RepID=M2XZQ3_GALSU|nr:uncharacterized protein Gasu_34540 [Galdieria sulphuraria]EME29059.1 hypothetical protein Gasu_34540 [Galdieria sulphuraria]|eukprot:XP_005705579.1 hypothetical protein Gasu_34540 [Galdieria sulphuraria]